MGCAAWKSRIREASDGHPQYARGMGVIRVGPARVPVARESRGSGKDPARARVFRLRDRLRGRLLDGLPWAERFGELAREADIVLSVHAPLAGFIGQVERDKKHRMAIGMLDHSAGVAGRAAPSSSSSTRASCSAGSARTRWPRSSSSSASYASGSRAKDRGVPFGVEVMGRVRELGTARMSSRSPRSSPGCGR